MSKTLYTSVIREKNKLRQTGRHTVNTDGQANNRLPKGKTLLQSTLDRKKTPFIITEPEQQTTSQQTPL